VRSRIQAALVQLAVFLGGGVLGPVWHLSHHRNDHAHGTDGRAITFALGEVEAPAHGHPHAPDMEPPAEAEAAAGAHPAVHAHRHQHAHPHGRVQGHRRAQQDPATNAETREQAGGQVLNRALRAAHDSRPDPHHGHGSLAHFGLALLGVPALLPLPTPEPGDWVPAVARTAALGLFHPSFPLPRPPPPLRAA
jgi:hypothetical protein